MNKLKIKFVLSTCLLPIPTNFQVFSQNQPSYRFIINKKEQQATLALQFLAREELYNGDYKVDLNISFLHSMRVSRQLLFFDRNLFEQKKYL